MQIALTGSYAKRIVTPSHTAGVNTMSQTFQQRSAIRAYCAHQRMARNEMWTGEGVGYTPEVREPELEPQPATWADALPFLIVAAIFAGEVLGLRIAGWL